jgi:glycosyltransferase involved in cell wall biosynthesis
MEVQSLVIIEALASGTPVVGLSNETVDELVDASDGIRLSKDASPREFAAAVHKICELGEAEYRKLCENSRSRVNTLDWSIVMEKTL